MKCIHEPFFCQTSGTVLIKGNEKERSGLEMIRILNEDGLDMRGKRLWLDDPIGVKLP